MALSPSNHGAKHLAKGTQWIWLNPEVLQLFLTDNCCLSTEAERTCPRFSHGDLSLICCGGSTATLVPVPGQHIKSPVAVVTENPEARHPSDCKSNKTKACSIEESRQNSECDNLAEYTALYSQF